MDPCKISVYLSICCSFSKTFLLLSNTDVSICLKYSVWVSDNSGLRAEPPSAHCVFVCECVCMCLM